MMCLPPKVITFLAVQEAGSVGKMCNVEIRFDWGGQKTCKPDAVTHSCMKVAEADSAAKL